MALQRVRTTWTNFLGQPGYTTHYYDGDGSAPLNLTNLRTFYDALKAGLPSGLHIAFPTAGDVINESDGAITGGWVSSATQADVTGLASGPYTGPAGMVVEWKTDEVLDGRRPIGKTFIVPLATIVLDSGTIENSFLTTARTAATALVTADASFLKIWHRPIKDEDPPHAVIRAGDSATVKAASIPDKQAVMRSRRD